MTKNTGRPLCSPRNWKRPVLLFCQTAARPLQIILELSFDTNNHIYAYMQIICELPFDNINHCCQSLWIYYLIIVITTISFITTITNITDFPRRDQIVQREGSILGERSSLFLSTNLDVITIFSQSGSHVSVSRRSEALGSFSSANLSQ